MLLYSDGRRFPRLWERVLLRVSSALRNRSLMLLRLRDKGYTSTYVCQTALDAFRPMTLWLKEEGTMHWIDREVADGDIFMDIGANIGIYSIAAAHRVGSAGRVYAFEPHKVNSLSLMRNVSLSALGDRVQIFSCALGHRSGVLRFNYISLDSASTASQLGHTRIPGSGQLFRPMASEMVFATTADQLLADEVIRPPHLVKIDVDGNELDILRGMKSLLTDSKRPRAVQVELNVGEQAKIVDFMAQCGYILEERHLTHAGKQSIARGESLENIAHNAIFRPNKEVRVDS